MLKINKKGFNLLEMVIAMVVSTFCLVAIGYYFSLNIKTSNIRYNELVKESQLTSLALIKNSIKEGHINTNGKTVEGNAIGTKSVTFTTTYFSKGTVNEKFSISCKDKADGTGTIVGKKNDEPEAVLVNNVSACNFYFYKGNGEATNQATQTRIIKLNVEYYIDKEKKNLEIYEKLMQET